ncbi:MAG: hypothetical protein [Olavius algarvensis Gamma 1 endosymbiont]|nr:MAG: hypothetical protein [Olavius algarvensis Gamma 1 endosymbiont]
MVLEEYITNQLKPRFFECNRKPYCALILPRPITWVRYLWVVIRVVPVDNFLIYKNIIRLDRPN